MQIITETAVLQTDTVVALGTFDGLHCAHRYIINRAKELAAKRGMHSAVYTFSELPSAYFGGEMHMLFSKEEKVKALEEMGVDYLCLQPFDQTIAEQSKEQFMDMLLHRLKAKALVVGYNFRFGKGAVGDAAFLRQYAAEQGVQAEVVARIDAQGEAVSSTRIRKAVYEGRMEEAARLLGHPYFIMGTIVHGREVGRKIGFPTANIYAPKEKLIPPMGVYISRIWLDGKAYGGITNIGRRPTLKNGEDVSVETNILQLQRDLYGKEAKVELLQFLRPERSFENLEELQQKIAENREQARRFFEGERSR